MQPLSLVSTDIMSTGSATGTSSAQAGQDANFTAHLAKAAAKQFSGHKHTGNSTKGEKDTADDASILKTSTDTETTKDTDANTSSTAEDASAATAITAATVYPAAIFFHWAATETGNPTAPVSNQAHKAATAIDRILSAVTLPGANKSTALAALLPTEGQTTAATDAAPATLPDTNATPSPGATETATPAPVSSQSQTALSFIPYTDLAISTTATSADAENNIEPAPTVSLAAGNEIAGMSTATSTQTTSTPSATIQQNAAQQGLGQIVQNEYNQIITIHQASKVEEIAGTPAISEQSAASTAGSDSRQDVNNSYLHSRLPGESPLASKNGDKGEQKETGSGEQQKNTPVPETAPPGGQAQTDQILAQKNQVTINQENQPLIFAHHRDAASAFASGNTTAMTSTDSSTLLRLPSGLVVPEGTVIDQMITRFSMNQRLESGSVNLKLYPQELGELRMEIKVEQDNIKAHIIAQNPQAQEMIDRHIPRLRAALEQQGLHLQHVEVTVATNDNSSDQRFQGNSSHEQLNRSRQEKLFQPSFTLDSIESLVEAESTTSNLNVLA